MLKFSKQEISTIKEVLTAAIYAAGKVEKEEEKVYYSMKIEEYTNLLNKISTN